MKATPKFSIKVLWVFITLFYQTNTFAQTPSVSFNPELGNFFVSNYSRSFINTIASNWALLQDPDGVMYIGNSYNGVIIFDGQKIRRVVDDQGNPKLGLCRAMVMDSKNNIYAILGSEVGLIEKNKFGESVFNSLSKNLATKDQINTTLWSAGVINDTVVFQSEKSVYLYKYKKLISIQHFKGLLHTVNINKNGAYLRIWDEGLFKLTNGKFVLLPATKELFAKNATWAQAMGLVVLEGIVILILVLTGFRIAVFKAIPTALKVAISVGIGLFIALIGLVDSGFVRRTPNIVWGSTNSKPSAVPLELGDGGQLVGWPIVVFTVGLLLTIILMVKKIKGSILIGIITSTILAVIVESQFKVGNSFISPTESNSRGWGLNTPTLPKGADGSLNFTDTPRFDTLGLGFEDIFGAFTNPKTGFLAALLLVFTLLLADFFDTMGTMTAIGNQAGLTDSKGNVEGANKILIVDSIAAATGGAAGISSNTSYIESATGVGEGARTGLASIVTGILFLLTTFLAPLVAIIPYEAATPALIIVGFLMMSQVKNIEWEDMGIGLPAFLTIILMPFTYNISVGIGAGFVSHVIIRVVQGRSKEVHPLLFLVSGLFMVYFLSSPINSWIG